MWKNIIAAIIPLFIIPLSIAQSFPPTSVASENGPSNSQAILVGAAVTLFVAGLKPTRITRYVLIALGGLFLLLAWCWSWLSPHVPTLAGSLQNAASNAWVWLIVFVVLPQILPAISYFFPKKKWDTEDLAISNENQRKITSIEFYDSRSEKNNLRGDLEKELSRSSEVWFAAIAGDQISQLATKEVFKKFQRIIINDPESAHAKRIASIQPIRGESFPHIARLAIKTCQEHGKGEVLKLSENFVLNVIISDPNESHGWARVQVFLPYFEGSDCPSFVVYKKERKDLFEIIKKSFDDMWKTSRLPTPVSPSVSVPPLNKIEKPSDGEPVFPTHKIEGTLSVQPFVFSEGKWWPQIMYPVKWERVCRFDYGQNSNGTPCKVAAVVGVNRAQQEGPLDELPAGAAMSQIVEVIRK